MNGLHRLEHLQAIDSMLALYTMHISDRARGTFHKPSLAVVKLAAVKSLSVPASFYQTHRQSHETFNNNLMTNDTCYQLQIQNVTRQQLS